MDLQRIIQLYDNVLEYDMYQFQLSEEAIRNGIASMSDVYKPGMNRLESARSNVANYNDPAHRCAYLHKYAALHTIMVRDVLYSAIQMNHRLFYDIVFSQDKFSICCMGGGPGNDAIAVLAALQLQYSYFPAAVSVIDYMENWKFSFISILRELGSGLYGAFGNNTHFLDWRYVGANLLKSLSLEVTDSLSSASLVTMIKFVSATSCKDTLNMINNIFVGMKPGGLLLFIDNAAGGFHELIMRAAKKHKFDSIFGPNKHVNYDYGDMKIKRFGYVSCFKTTVTVHLLQKPLNYHLRSWPLLENCGFVPNFARRAIFGSPPTNTYPPSPLTPYLGSPLTPYVHEVRPQEILDFSRDEYLDNSNNNFPSCDIPQSPYNMPLHSYVATPINGDLVNSPSAFENPTPIYGTPIATTTRWKRRRSANKGCLPLPVNRWRHHLSKKINKIKSRAATVFKKNGKGEQHPVFRI